MTTEATTAEVEVRLTILQIQEVAIVVGLQRSIGVREVLLIIDHITAVLTIAEALAIASAGRATQGLTGIVQADLQEAEVAATIDLVEVLRDLRPELVDLLHLQDQVDLEALEVAEEVAEEVVTNS